MYKNKINNFKILFLVAMAVELASCHVTKNIYTPPKVDTLNILRSEGGNNLDTATIANIPWKEYFKDPKLQALIGEGLKNNIDQQIAITRIKEAEATLDMSRAATLPS
ncbi:MAG: TolC family protein, partial [Bacteroidota bacterium]|nr:TolC family protein [Bacteroidota bacterium]